MKILLVAATAGEIDVVFHYFGGKNMPQAGQPPFTINYREHEIDFLITGIGMVPTVYATTRALAHKKYDLAINVGIAGGLKDNPVIRIGHVFHIISACFPEVGAEAGQESHLSLNDMQLPGADEFPFVNGVMHNNHVPACIRALLLPELAGYSVNLVTGSLETQIRREQRSDAAAIETMEGGGFFYACLKENVPFAELRAVSNYIGLRDRASWKIPEAMAALNKTLIQLFDTL